MAGGDGGGGDRDQLGAPDFTEHFDRVGHVRDAAHCLIHSGPLTGEPGVVHTGASANPRRRLVTDERATTGTRRWCRRCPSRRARAGRRRAPRPSRTGSRRRARSVPSPAPARCGCRRWANRPRHRRRTVAPAWRAKRVHRRTPSAECLEHRRGDRRRVGAHPLGLGDAVVGGEDQPDRPLDSWPISALPAGDPLGQFVEGGQRALVAAGSGRPVRGPQPRPWGRARGGREQLMQQRHPIIPHGSSRRNARPATTSRVVSAAAATIWFTRPSRSRYRPELALGMDPGADLVAHDDRRPAAVDERTDKCRGRRPSPPARHRRGASGWRPTGSGSRRRRARRRRPSPPPGRARPAPRSSASRAASPGGGRCAGEVLVERRAGGDEDHRAVMASTDLHGQRALPASGAAEEEGDHQ